MLQSSAVKPSSGAGAAAAAAAAGSVVTDPTLRLMAAAAAAAGGAARSGRPTPSELTSRPSVVAAAAANELYASLLYSQQLDHRAALHMMQQQNPFSMSAAAAAQRGHQTQVAVSGHTQPPQAHTGAATGGFSLPHHYHHQPVHAPPPPHPHHLQGPAAAAAFESYSQSLATLSQLSQRLQLHGPPHARLPGPPTALGVDPYLAAAAAAAVQSGRTGSPPVCSRRQATVSSPSKTPPTLSDSSTASALVVGSKQNAAAVQAQHSASPLPRHRSNPYDFCVSEESDMSPHADDKFRVIRCYKHDGHDNDDAKESHHRHHYHHHQQQQQQQQQAEGGVQVGDGLHDENHNAFSDDSYRHALQLPPHQRIKRPEVVSSSIAHAQTAAAILPLPSQSAANISSDVPSKRQRVGGTTGNGSNVMSRETREMLSSGGRSSKTLNYKSDRHHHHHQHRHRHRGRADFTHGSMIQLSDGRIKRIEDMRTEDFVMSEQRPAGVTSSMTSSRQLVLVSSRVVHIRLNHDTCTAVLGFIVDNMIHSPVSVEAPLEQPFFVHGFGWSSCDPARTHARYQLTCRQLSVGDTCISLTAPHQQRHCDVSSRHCSHLSAEHTSQLLHNSRDSSTWTEREQHDDSKRLVTSGQLGLTSGQRDGPSAAAVISRKRRWSAPDRATTPTHHHGNHVNNSSSNSSKIQHGSHFAASSK